MGTFNSLLYATKLVNTGVPRDQAEVHAQVLQDVYDEEHKQYATKADFATLSSDMRAQIIQLDIKTDRIAAKTDQLEVKIDQVELKMGQVETRMGQVETRMGQVETRMGQVEEKIIQIEIKLSCLQIAVEQLKDQFARFNTELSVLKTSCKYILWIGGGLATLCVSTLGLCIAMFLHTLK